MALYCANMIIGNNPLGVINIAQLAHNNLHISISNVWKLGVLHSICYKLIINQKVKIENPKIKK